MWEEPGFEVSIPSWKPEEFTFAITLLVTCRLMPDTGWKDMSMEHVCKKSVRKKKKTNEGETLTGSHVIQNKFVCALSELWRLLYLTPSHRF